VTSWSPQQERALDAVGAWLEDPHADQVFRLFGYAGTGKTTLAKHLAESAGRVLFGAYTGKAAHVLRQKGCVGATTIHSLLYLPSGGGGSVEAIKKLEADVEAAKEALAKAGEPPPRTEGGVDFKVLGHPSTDARRRLGDAERALREAREKARKPFFMINPESPIADADLVVIDECSMVGGQMADDLMHWGKKILVLGDPAQLPPVGGEGFFTASKPDVLLTEVHRHARESGILRAATAVRETRRVPIGGGGDDFLAIPLRNVDRDVLRKRVLAADQVLVGANKTRHAQNSRIRQLLGCEGEYPVPGDKLVCLRNDHRVGLLNGSLWRSTSSEPVDNSLLALIIDGEDEGTPRGLCVTAHTLPFLGRENELVGWVRREAQEFDFGYALTVHKSQGSQWRDVVVFDESWVARGEGWRWLYTAITRASDRVLVVQ